MSITEQDFQDFIDENYLPLALLINDNGDIMGINEAGKRYFSAEKKHIKEVFSKVFLDVYNPIFEECKATGRSLRIPVFFNFIKPIKKQFMVTVSPYKESKQEQQFVLVFQLVAGDMQFTLTPQNVKPIETEAELKEFIDELQAANEEINASNEELTTVNEELNSYKNYLEEMVQERTEELEKQRTQFKNIINNLPGAVLKYRLDADGKDSIVFLSEQAGDLWEIPKGDLLKNVNLQWEITFEEDLPSMRESIAKSAAELTIWHHQWRIETKSGKTKWLEGQAVPEKKEDGAVEWDAIILDITDRKKAELELKSKTAVLERTESIANIGSWEWEIAKDEIIWSREVYNIFEFDASLPPPPFSEHEKIHTKESFERLGVAVERAVKEGIPYEVELEIVTLSGVHKYCYARGYARKSHTGEITHLYGSFQDITKRRTAEIALEKQNEILERTQSLAKIGSWEWYPDEDKAVWSDEVFKIFELDPKKEALNFYQEQRKLYSKKSLKELDESVIKAIDEATPYELELEVITASGELKYCVSSGFPVTDSNGKVTHLFGFFQDISKLKESEIELRRQKAILERTEAVAQIGSWEWNVAKDEVTWSDELFDIFELDSSEGAPNYYIEHHKLYTEDSLKALNESVERSIKSVTPFELELEAITASGEIKYCTSRGFPDVDENGKVVYMFGFLQDISKLKESEIELRRQKAILERTEAVAQIGSWEWNVAKDEVTWSDELYRIFERDPALGAPSYKEHPKIYTKNSYKELDEAVQRAVKYGLPFEHESEIITSSGAIKYCISRGYAQKDENGNVTHLYGSFQDVTHRKIAEIRWKESQEDYKAITDSVPGVVLKYQLNPDGTDKLLYLSKGVENLHELSQEEAIKNVSLIWERIHPDDLDKFIASVQKSAEELTFWNIEYRLLMPDGRVKWANGRGMPKKLPDGAVVWNTLLMDISNIINAEHELQSINDQLDLAIETAQLGVWTLDTQTNKLEWNDVILEIYGLTREEFENDLDGWQDQVHPEDKEASIKELSRIFEGDRVADVQFRIIRPNGEIRHILASGAPLKDGDKLTKLVGINIDITQVKLYETELLKAKEKAERSEVKLREKNKALEKANAELDRFVYSVSHDLRAPIASAVGLSKLTLDTENLDEIRHLNSLKIKTLNRLDQFIRDILDYSRNSRLELKKDALNFKETVELMLIEYHQDIQEKGVEVKVDVEGEEIFHTDKLRLNIILNNLMSNAFKFLNDYKEKPVIEIAIKTNPDFAEIAISDNGIGIEPERQEKIFEMFYRANDQKPGSGIGLYILKECLDKLQGDISLESKVNKGTTFYLKIPALKD